MKERNMTADWFNSEQLQVFDRKELNFRKIMTFKDACEAQVQLQQH